MAKQSIGTLPGKIYELLADLEAIDRTRVVAATLALFGDEAPTKPPSNSGDKVREYGAKDSDARSYFTEKDPQNKGEHLAVAAKFLEETTSAEQHNKEEFKAAFKAARRNFDIHNFVRDMKNATGQAGFFTKGGTKGSHQLSHYGQEFVDALPDRDEAKKLKRPKRGTKTKAKRKTDSRKSSKKK